MRELKTFCKILFAALLIFSSALNSFSQTVEEKIFTQIDSVVMKVMDENKIVGLSVGIVKDDKIFYTKGYGSKEINKDEPIDSVTNFLTCSISKLFTATAIMQLSEEGKIDIHKKLIDYIPDFKMKDGRYKDITIEQILTHTSGLPNVLNKNFIHPESDSTTLSEFAVKLRRKKLSYEPGVQLSEKTYSNTGYDILGLVIEKITHQTYSHYVSENILKPVGMCNSSFFHKQIDEKRRSIPHKKNWLTGKIKASKYYPDIPQDKPCGNLNSCSYDLCKWMLYNLAIYNSTNDSSGVIEKNTLQNMWTTQEKIPPYKTSIGLGWWIFDSEKYGKYVFHDGNDPGYCAALIISPENNFGIIVLCNSLYPKDVVWNKLPFEIIDLFGSEWKK